MLKRAIINGKIHQVFSTKTLVDIFGLGSYTVTKILNGHYIKLAKEKEEYATQKSSV